MIDAAALLAFLGAVLLAWAGLRSIASRNSQYSSVWWRSRWAVVVRSAVEFVVGVGIVGTMLADRASTIAGRALMLFAATMYITYAIYHFAMPAADCDCLTKGEKTSAAAGIRNLILSAGLVAFALLGRPDATAGGERIAVLALTTGAAVVLLVVNGVATSAQASGAGS